MSPTVEELAKALANAPPPAKNKTRTKGFAVPEWRNPFAESLPVRLSSPTWRGITTVEEAQKALYIASGRQTLDTFKLETPKLSPFAGALAERMGTSLAFNGVLEAMRPKVGGFGPLMQGVTRIGQAMAPWARLFGRLVERLDQASRAFWPKDPRGQPVPRHNVRLYLLARWAYQGDWEARAAFLNEIQADSGADNVLFIEDLLTPTFAPQRPDKRTCWERMAPLEARRVLRERLADLKDEARFRRFGGVPLDPEIIEPKDQHKDKRKVLDPDVSEFLLQEAIYAALPEKQAEVVWLYATLHDEARPRETTAAIAEFLQISPATVRWHKAEAAKNPQFRKVLGSW